MQVLFVHSIIFCFFCHFLYNEMTFLIENVKSHRRTLTNKHNCKHTHTQHFMAEFNASKIVRRDLLRYLSGRSGFSGEVFIGKVILIFMLVRKSWTTQPCSVELECSLQVRTSNCTFLDSCQMIKVRQMQNQFGPIFTLRFLHIMRV